MLGKLIGATLIIMASLPANAQVPAAPPLPGQDVLGQKLVRSIETKNLAAYSALLAENVAVFEDGKQVAASKDAWLAVFGKKLVAEGVAFEVSPGFSSTGRLLYIEYFNSAGSWGTEVPAHCCWSYDAVAYDVAGGRVTAIRRLRGGSTKLDKHGSLSK